LKKVFLALGSNIGDREKNIKRAVELLKERIFDIKVANLYRTAPVGVEEQPGALQAHQGQARNAEPRPALRLHVWLAHRARQHGGDSLAAVPHSRQRPAHYGAGAGRPAIGGHQRGGFRAGAHGLRLRALLPRTGAHYLRVRRSAPLCAERSQRRLRTHAAGDFAHCQGGAQIWRVVVHHHAAAGGAGSHHPFAVQHGVLAAADQ